MIQKMGFVTANFVLCTKKKSIMVPIMIVLMNEEDPFNN